MSGCFLVCPCCEDWIDQEDSRKEGGPDEYLCPGCGTWFDQDQADAALDDLMENSELDEDEVEEFDQ